MADLQSTTCRFLVPSPKKTSSFEAGQDDLLLRESQVRSNSRKQPRHMTTLPAAIVEFLRDVAGITAREFECLSNADHRITCTKCPCIYADRLHRLGKLEIHNGEQGRLPCTLTLAGKIDVETVAPILAAARKA
jgi:hypothetical protein